MYQGENQFETEAAKIFDRLFSENSMFTNSNSMCFLWLQSNKCYGKCGFMIYKQLGNSFYVDVANL